MYSEYYMYSDSPYCQLRLLEIVICLYAENNCVALHDMQDQYDSYELGQGEGQNTAASLFPLCVAGTAVLLPHDGYE